MAPVLCSETHRGKIGAQYAYPNCRAVQLWCPLSQLVLRHHEVKSLLNIADDITVLYLFFLFFLFFLHFIPGLLSMAMQPLPFNSR